MWLEDSEGWPWFSFVQLGYELGPDTRSGHAWAGGLAIDLPLFGTNRAGVRRAEARRELAELELEAASTGLVSEVSSRWRRMRAAHAALDIARKGTMGALERATTAVHNAIAAGHADALDGLRIEIRAVNFKMKALRLLRDYWNARMDLMESLGPTKFGGEVRDVEAD